MNRLRYLIIAIVSLIVLAGCGPRESRLLGRWEGTSNTKYRITLTIEPGGEAKLSKSGVFFNQPVHWSLTDSHLVVKGEKQENILSLEIYEDSLQTDSGLKLSRPGPLSGFRYSILIALVALIVSWLLTPWVKKLAFAKGAVDDPKRDDRRVHKEPLARWGGLAIYAGFMVALLTVLPFAYREQGLPFPPYLIGIMIIGGLVVIVGAMDDLKQYSAKIQASFLLAAGIGITLFGMHDKTRVLIAGISWPPFVGGSHWVSFGLMAIPLTAIYIFVISKTMDTIDGIDGLASGIAAIAGGTLSIIATFEGQPRVALIAAALAGSSLGFLRHNFNPAKIIMGTGGAQLLGFVLAALSIVGAMKTAATLVMLIPLFVFGVPLFDAVQVVIRRKLSGVPITQADKRHIHHQLLDRGLSQRQVVLVLYILTIILCTLLVLAVRLYG
jgi:UDP-GlcNAc:undecaprenyl-phosphate GlcNAc-1-phosphate transferase